MKLTKPSLTDNFSLPVWNGNSTTTENELKEIENRTSNCILEMPIKPTYIGSTITIYAGTKVLIPNGRNIDGTLKNIEHTLTTDRVLSIANYNINVTFYMYSYEVVGGVSTSSILHADRFSDMPTIVGTAGYFKCYCEETNLWYSTNGSTTANWSSTNQTLCIIGTAVVGASEITSLTPYNVLKYVDTNMINELESVELGNPNSNLGAITTHTAIRKGGVVRYKLVANTGNWIGGTIYSVCTLNDNYRPTVPYSKRIMLTETINALFVIGTDGNVSIIPSGNINSLLVRIDETTI